MFVTPQDRASLACSDPEMGDAGRLFAQLRENALDPPGVTRATYGPGETMDIGDFARGCRLLDALLDELG